jgi:hypothetical protein
MRSVIFDPALRFVPVSIVWARGEACQGFHKKGVNGH